MAKKISQPMTSIRKSTFETNSSSAHTLILVDEKENTSWEDIAKEIFSFGSSITKFNVDSTNMIDGFPAYDVLFNVGYFGHGFEILSDWYGKLQYFVASMDFMTAQAFLKEFASHIPGCRNIFLPGVYNVEATTLTEGNRYAFDDDGKRHPLPLATFPMYPSIEYSYGFTGEIDHQSTSLPDSIINCFREKDEGYFDAIIRVILSNRFVILIDSDCNDSIGDILYSGLFNSEITHILVESYSDNDYGKPTARLVTRDDYIETYNDDYYDSENGDTDGDSE